MPLTRRALLLASGGVTFSSIVNANSLDGKITVDDEVQAFQALKNSRLISKDGRSIDVNQFRGKFLIVNFWAYWCPNCIVEFQSLGQLQQLAGGPTKLDVLLISTKDNWERDKAFAQQNRVPFALSYIEPPESPKVVFGEMQGSILRNGLPISYIIRPDGSLATVHIGGADWMGSKASAVQVRCWVSPGSCR
jgi:thiol-disulfide isomerase/thioredoxin